MNSHQRRIKRRAEERSKPDETEKEVTEMAAKPKPENIGENRQHRITGRALNILRAILVFLATVSGVLAFYPRITVSDPVQMDTTDFFSYKIAVTNDGLLPVYNANWAFALRSLKLSPQPGRAEVTMLLPHCADWRPTAEFEKRLQSNTEQKAIIMAHPGATLIDEGPADYRFHLSRLDKAIGALTPGTAFTVTTEKIIGADNGSTYDNADFAIAIRYTPVFPPIPMQTCSNFKAYRDKQGNYHWFRTGNQCDRFPWLHPCKQSSPTDRIGFRYTH